METALLNPRPIPKPMVPATIHGPKHWCYLVRINRVVLGALVSELLHDTTANTDFIRLSRQNEEENLPRLLLILEQTYNRKDTFTFDPARLTGWWLLERLVEKGNEYARALTE